MGVTLLGIVTVICSTWWLHLNAPVLPIGALLALLAKDVKKLGKARLPLIALGCLIGAFGQGLHCGMVGDSDNFTFGFALSTHPGEDDVFIERTVDPAMIPLVTPGKPMPTQPGDEAVLIDPVKIGLPAQPGKTTLERTAYKTGAWVVRGMSEGDVTIGSTLYSYTSETDAAKVFDFLESSLQVDLQGGALGFTPTNRVEEEGEVRNIGTSEQTVGAIAIYRNEGMITLILIAGADFASADEAHHRLHPHVSAMRAAAQP